MRPLRFDGRAIGLGGDDGACNPIAVTPMRKSSSHDVKRIGQQTIIGTEPTDDVASGALQAFVDGLGLAIVGLNDERAAGAFDAVSPLFEDVDRAIGGLTIDDDVFKIGIVLIVNALKRLLNKLSLVVARRDEGNARPLSGSHLRGGVDLSVLAPMG